MDVEPNSAVFVVLDFGGRQAVRRFNAAVAATARPVQPGDAIYDGDDLYGLPRVASPWPDEVRRRYRPYPFLRRPTPAWAATPNRHGLPNDPLR